MLSSARSRAAGCGPGLRGLEVQLVPVDATGSFWRS